MLNHKRLALEYIVYTLERRFYDRSTESTEDYFSALPETELEIVEKYILEKIAALQNELGTNHDGNL